jgi:hypothetical protein
VNFEINPNGQFVRLSLNKLPADAVRAMQGQPVDPGKRETVLGETCTWFDLLAGAADAGLTQCRTDDGLVLKERRTGRGLWVDLVAVSLERSAVTPSQVSPAGMLARANWGLAE